MLEYDSCDQGFCDLRLVCFAGDLDSKSRTMCGLKATYCVSGLKTTYCVCRLKATYYRSGLKATYSTSTSFWIKDHRIVSRLKAMYCVML